MTNSKDSSLIANSAALISIHPVYASMISRGEKKVEFRRVWTARPVRQLVIYATAPVQKIVALAEIDRVFRGSKTALWHLSKHVGGGISRRKLFDYLAGKESAFGLTLQEVTALVEPLDPAVLFGADFRPPQSFRYMKAEESLRLANILGTDYGSHFCGGGAWGGQD